METLLIIVLIATSGMAPSCSKKSSSKSISYTAEYEYPQMPELLPGDGEVEIQAIAISSCKDPNGIEVDISNCDNGKELPYKKVTSPPGTVTIPVFGAINGYAKIDVQEGENVSQLTPTEINNRISDVLVCESEYVKHFHECKTPGFELILSNYSLPTKTSVCSGTEFLNRTVLGCRDSVTSLDTDEINCSDLSDPAPSIVHKSPYGERNVVLSGNNIREKCDEGETNWVKIAITCNNPLEHEENLDCVNDTLEARSPVYPENNLSPGDGIVAVLPIDFSTCFNITKDTAIEKTHCSLPTTTINFLSPYGERDVTLTDLISHEHVLEGSTEWVRNDVTCTNVLLEKKGEGENSTCLPIALPATPVENKTYLIKIGESVSIPIEMNNPDSVELSCSITPSLPTGITLNNCSLTGNTSIFHEEMFDLEVTSSIDGVEIGRNSASIKVKSGQLVQTMTAPINFSEYPAQHSVKISPEELLLFNNTKTTIYNLKTNTHQTFSVAPESRINGTLVKSSLGRVYLLGGAKTVSPTTANFVSFVEYFDLSSKTWVRTSGSFSLNVLAPLLEEISPGKFFVLNGYRMNSYNKIDVNLFGTFDAVTGEWNSLLSSIKADNPIVRDGKVFFGTVEPYTFEGKPLTGVTKYSVFDIGEGQIIDEILLTKRHSQSSKSCFGESGFYSFLNSILPGQMSGPPTKVSFNTESDSLVEEFYTGPSMNLLNNTFCKNDLGVFENIYQGLTYTNDDSSIVINAGSNVIPEATGVQTIIKDWANGKGVYFGSSTANSRVIILDSDFLP